MGSKTGIIKYNVRDRGRRYRGAERNFDTAALAAIVNSGAIQERVKHRDMIGYYGHGLRVKFGMTPPESVILDGKVVYLEPAVVTTHLKALPDGTIEHETEFLDTAPGKLAERLFMSKAGGFSSAIDAKRCGDKSVPNGFFGFDYVYEPNFSTNRGYEVALDGVANESDLSMFDAIAEYKGIIEGANALYDSLQTAYERQAEAMLRIQQENEQLMSMLARQGSVPTEIHLDGIVAEAFGGGESRLRKSDEFMSLALPGYEALPDTEPKKEDPTKGVLGRMFNIRG